jgi:hypothetical protein
MAFISYVPAKQRITTSMWISCEGLAPSHENSAK